MTWDELVESITARHPVHESKMFGMPCLKRENGKVVTGVGSTEPAVTRRCRLRRRRSGHWKDGGVNVKLVDEAQREAALAIPGAMPFDPGMGRPMREWVLVPPSQSDQWERLVDQAVSSVGSTELPKSGGAGFAGTEADSG
jgi:hypothetical protein